jgi:hypothetical protein
VQSVLLAGVTVTFNVLFCVTVTSSVTVTTVPSQFV